MQNETVNLNTIVKSLHGCSRTIATIVGTTIFIFSLLVVVLPSKYKSTTKIAIQTGFFQNPMVRDFFPEVTDNAELKVQKENLIRKTFSKEVLGEVAEKYHLYKTAKTDANRQIEEYNLLKSIEVFAVDISTFSLSFVGRSPQETYDVTNELLARVLDSLAKERTKNMLSLRNSLRKRIETMAIVMDGVADPVMSARPELLSAELDRIDAQIRALKNRYSDKHPEVSKLIARSEILKRWIQREEGGAQTKSDSTPMPFVGREPKDSMMNAYTDLLKKLNYINIVLDMDNASGTSSVAILQPPTYPTGPIFPRLPVFIFWGLLVGILLSTVFVLTKKYRDQTRPSPLALAEQFKIELFGTFPSIDWTSGQIAPQAKAKKGRENPVDAWQ